MDKGQASLAMLDSYDEDYARGEWLPECIAWDNAGVYKKLADFIGLKDGEVHLDLGCGTGTLALELRERFNQAILWAVDRNLAMIRMAEVLAEGFHFSHEVHARYGLSLRDGGKAVQTDFILDSSRLGKMHPFKPGGPIQFILDDIRQMKVVKAILGERKIDSCSFVFPGYGARSVFEAPFSLGDTPPNDEESKARMWQYIDSIRKAACRFASERVKKGGQFIIVERSPIADRDIATETLIGFLGEYGKYWDWSAVCAAEVAAMRRPDGRSYVTRLPDGSVVESSVAYAYAFKLIRNEVLFEE